MRLRLKNPGWEILLLGGTLIASFLALAILSARSGDPLEGNLSTGAVAGYVAVFFFLSLSISLVAVVAGIGGGVLFTPILLAFTPIDSLLVRALGLLLAMVSGLIASGNLIRRGLGNLRLCLLMSASQGLGALIGAVGAILVYHRLGAAGEAAVRVLLGLILAGVSTHLLLGGNGHDESGTFEPDAFTQRLRLSKTYYEASEKRAIEYRLRRARAGGLLLFGVGLIGGFFGMGAGWAITPVLHLVMGAPLKIAAANSVMILGMGGAVAVWPYILIGALLPIFALPWISGQVMGGYLGSLLLVRMRVYWIRYILIAILYFTSFSLVAKGLELTGVIRPIPPAGSLAVLVLLALLVVRQARRAAGRRTA